MTDVLAYDGRYRGRKPEKVGTARRAPVRSAERSKKPEKKPAPLIPASLVIGAIAVSWVLHKGEVADDSCTGPTKQLVMVGSVTGPYLETKNNIRKALDVMPIPGFDDNRTLSGVADQLSKDRGYYIPVNRLITVNNKADFVQRDEEGNIIDQMPEVSTGTYCVNVPGPIYGGYRLVSSEGMTIKDIADEEMVDVSVLKKMNPEYAKFDETDSIIPGSVLKVDAEVDPTMVVREMSKEESTINDLSKGNVKLRDKLVMANAAFLAQGLSVKAGDVGVLPIVETPFMKESEISTKEIVAAYAKTNVKLPVDLKGVKTEPVGPPAQKPKNGKVEPKPKQPEIPNASLEAFKDKMFSSRVRYLAKQSKNAMDGDTLVALINKHEAASKSGVISRNLIAVQLWHESKFNPRARSHVGAQGIAQFMPGTWKTWGKGSPNDPDAAIKAQFRFMNRLYDLNKERFTKKPHYELLALSLAAYNAGPYNKSVVNGKVPVNGETDVYVKRILSDLAEMEAEQAQVAD